MSSSSKARAEQAKARAEEKFRRRDVAGARAAALDAKSLFPGLPGLAPALAAYQVHFSAATRRLPTGAVDWHAVLDVPRNAAADAVKRQFKRLCLLTHPDKNASAAADGAFKLVVEAYENVSAAFARAPPATTGSRQRGAAGEQSGPGVSGFHSYPTGSRPGTSASASSSFSGRRPGPNFSGFSSFPTGSRPQPSTSASDSSGSTSTAAPTATAADDDSKIPARVVEIALTCPYCGSGSVRVAVNGDRVTATVPCQRCSRYFAIPEKQRR
ncbi:uncharacterized protein LOC109724217 [Ananas comosus]|uniref:Uncharacterized protein LOC109724217 n=1 Tax=Ananas comosus TaxID=4615 RepID=A0A6P5GRJ3_ANACO|nr:uncharacterized protein LOC109724217 [Ananas comosus]